MSKLKWYPTPTHGWTNICFSLLQDYMKELST